MLLVKMDTDINLYNQNHSVMKILISAGTDLEIRDKNGETILISMSRIGDAEIIKLLIKAGADLCACSNSFYTPCVVAVLNGHTHVFDIIKQAFMD